MKLGVKQEKWLKALESGRYKQGSGALCYKNGNHCCLGVAARTMRKKFVSDKGDAFTVDGKGGFLADYTSLGLSGCGGELIGGRLTDKEASRYFEFNQLYAPKLTNINDATDTGTFKQIARFIRENPERVFTESK